MIKKILKSLSSLRTPVLLFVVVGVIPVTSDVVVVAVVFVVLNCCYHLRRTGNYMLQLHHREGLRSGKVGNFQLSFINFFD